MNLILKYKSNKINSLSKQSNYIQANLLPFSKNVFIRCGLVDNKQQLRPKALSQDVKQIEDRIKYLQNSVKKNSSLSFKPQNPYSLRRKTVSLFSDSMNTSTNQFSLYTPFNTNPQPTFNPLNPNEQWYVKAIQAHYQQHKQKQRLHSQKTPNFSVQPQNHKHKATSSTQSSHVNTLTWEKKPPYKRGYQIIHYK